jgi:hypothetical protein
MENGELTPPLPTHGVVVRDYAPTDYAACRMLWAELTEHHRRIYGAPSVASWVALAGRRHGWLEGARLHGLDFRY